MFRDGRVCVGTFDDLPMYVYDLCVIICIVCNRSVDGGIYS